MERLALSFFPFPHVLKGKRYRGLNYEWPDRCNKCDRQCETSTATGLQLCSYGVNYYRLDADTLVAGLVVRDFKGNSQARTKMLKRVSRGPSVAEVESARQAFAAIAIEEAAEIRDRKDALIEEYRSSEAYKQEVVRLLQPELKRMLAQIHDYRQFVSQVAQNVNVLLERRSPGVEMDRKLAQASHEEQAIYWAARLMGEKIETALFLLDPERIEDPASIVAFRFHGCVTKYLRIYQRAFDQKQIDVRVLGESFGRVRANPAALSVIPHTLIDNALKYAPRRSTVEIAFSETPSEITMTVSSHGPKIDGDETARIFDLFYRGREARRIEPDGTGFGLHLSQLIASKLGTKITVSQRSEPDQNGLHWTKFSIRFSRS